MEITALPASWSAWARGGGHRGVPDGGEHDEVGVGGVVVGAGLEAGDPVAPALPQLVDDLLRPLALPRPDARRRGPTLASRAAMPRPAGPVPPNTPILHARELRTAPPPSPTPAISRACVGVACRAVDTRSTMVDGDG